MHHASGVAMHVMHQYAANCQYDASWPGWRWWCRRWKLCADTLMHHGSPEARHNCVPVSALVSGPWHGQFSGAQQPWVSWRNWPGRGGDTEDTMIQLSQIWEHWYTCDSEVWGGTCLGPCNASLRQDQNYENIIHWHRYLLFTISLFVIIILVADISVLREVNSIFIRIANLNKSNTILLRCTELFHPWGINRIVKFLKF